MRYIRLFEEHINEIGDASHKPFKWRLEKPYGEEYYNSPEDLLKDYEKDSGNDYGYTMYQFTTDKGTDYEVEMTFEIYTAYGAPIPKLDVEIDFYTQDNQGNRNHTQDMTNKGELFSVMATVIDCVVHWINLWDKHFYMRRIEIVPKREDDDSGIDATDSRRGKIYLQYIRKQLRRLKNKNGKYQVRVYDDYFKIEPSWHAEDQ